MYAQIESIFRKRVITTLSIKAAKKYGYSAMKQGISRIGFTHGHQLDSSGNWQRFLIFSYLTGASGPWVGQFLSYVAKRYLTWHGISQPYV